MEKQPPREAGTTTKPAGVVVRVKADFLIVAKEVLVYNLGPFSSSLGSLFKGDIAGIGSSPA